jgi:hypothetical protein
MRIDTSIYNALMQPRRVADYAAEYDQQDIRAQTKQANALALQAGQQKVDEYGRVVRDKSNALNALSGAPAGAGMEGQINALMGSGTEYGLTQAEALRKQMIEQQKARAEAAKTNAGLLRQYSGVLMQSPTQQTAAALLAHYEQATGDRAENIREILAQAGENPEVLRRIAAALAMEADKLLPKTQTIDAGNARVQQAVNPISGVATETGRVPIMQSPDSAATAGTAAARLKFDREKLADEQKSRPGAPGAIEKPLPPVALKMQQESLDAIAISSSIVADLAAVEKQIADGKLKFGPISNLANAGLNMAGMSTEESRNFASFKSTLERLRNESLRLNAGVQTDGDAQRAWNELFQNINDTNLVKQRLAEIQNINKRGAQHHRLRIDSVRANYGVGPLDAGAYAAQPPALGGAPAAPAAAPAADGNVIEWDSLDKRTGSW